MSYDSGFRVSCLLLTSHGFHVLLPNACIVEVLPIAQFERGPNPDWVAGSTVWRQHKTYLISPAAKRGDPVSTTDRALFVAILRTPLTETAEFKVGLLATEMPHLIQADMHNLETDLNPKTGHPLAIQYVQIQRQPALIPDIESIDRLVARLAG